MSEVPVLHHHLPGHEAPGAGAPDVDGPPRASPAAARGEEFHGITLRIARPPLRTVAPGGPGMTAFLDDFARNEADGLARDGGQAWCTVTVLRNGEAGTAASSGDRARELDEMQRRSADGPCLTAAREQVLVHVGDVRTDRRWPAYAAAAAHRDVRAVLAVPFELAGVGPGCLGLSCDRPHAFDSAQIRSLQDRVGAASQALHLAVRLHGGHDRAAAPDEAVVAGTAVER